MGVDVRRADATRRGLPVLRTLGRGRDATDAGAVVIAACLVGLLGWPFLIVAYELGGLPWALAAWAGYLAGAVLAAWLFPPRRR